MKNASVNSPFHFFCTPYTRNKILYLKTMQIGLTKTQKFCHKQTKKIFISSFCVKKPISLACSCIDSWKLFPNAKTEPPPNIICALPASHWECLQQWENDDVQYPISYIKCLPCYKTSDTIHHLSHWHSLIKNNFIVYKSSWIQLNFTNFNSCSISNNKNQEFPVGYAIF